jgi:radical SAM family uncharacterized protein/radical SAM-linked protein
MHASAPDPRHDDPRHDDPRELSRTLLGRVLPLVAKPGRYIGGEYGSPAADRWRPQGVNILLCFPDAYEVGMSHVGLRVLHHELNLRDDTFCDLAFAPWPDMEAAMRREGLPLYGLASRRPARQFDLIGFSLGYELGFTNVLTMLDLAGLALRAAARREGDPLVVAGGSCAMNPAVIGPFCDAVLPGDGEPAVADLAALLARARAEGWNRSRRLAGLHAVPGAWHPGVSSPVPARVLADLNASPPPDVMVATIEPVHDRIAIEVMRGCARGCRFCQAGMIQRPVRERNTADIVTGAATTAARTGLREIGLLSLSTSDFSGLDTAVAGIQDTLAGTHTNLVLPSLRVDSVSPDLYERISRERPSSFTFAPEAGTQRLRDVVNKRLAEADILRTAADAFRGKVKTMKLYFMIGLPTETDDDLRGILDLVARVAQLAPEGGTQLTVSVSPFSPKAHTPFQWAGQISRDELARRNQMVASGLRGLRVKVSLRDPDISVLEAVLGLGDDRLAPVVEAAWRAGARFDGWEEYFDAGRWQEAFRTVGVDPLPFVQPRDVSAPLPWDTVRGPVDRAFLAAEWARALAGETTPDCRLEGACVDCAACGDGIGHVAARLEPAAIAVSKLAVEPSAPATTPAADPPTARSEQWRHWREQASAKVWYRLEYRKQGAMAFLGHLDFQRQLQFALRRSFLPIAYSKGYHPHPLLKFGPPLPVGVAGEREVLDVALLNEAPGLAARLDREMPAGLGVLRAVVVGTITPPPIEWRAQRLDYRVVFPDRAADRPDPDSARAAVTAFLAADRWLSLRRRPKGDAEVDARGLVPAGGLVWETGPGELPPLRVSLVRQGEGAGLPIHDFLGALFGAALPEPRFCSVTRTGMSGCDARGRWLSPLDEVLETRRQTWLQGHLNG